MTEKYTQSLVGQAEAELELKKVARETESAAESFQSVQKKSGFLGRYVWPVLRVPLYIVFLIASVVLILLALEKVAYWSLGKTYVSSIYPGNLIMARRDFTMPVSHYDYDFVPGVCLEYNISKGNRYEYANNAGFREPRDIPKEKPADEYRVFLTGGSTAFGMGPVGEAAFAMNNYGIEYRETISHALEMILNATAPIEGKTIKVYNTAVWGHAYQHLLMRYMTKLRDYSPDLVISLDGANELPMISKLTPDWNYFREGQFHNILEEVFAYNGPGLSSYLTLWFKNNSYLVTLFWNGRDLFQELNKGIHMQRGLSETFGTDPFANLSVEEKSRRVDRNIAAVVRVMEDYHAALQNDGIPHIIALQPWFYLSQKQKHEKEQILDSLSGYRTYYGIPSDKMYQLYLERARQSAERTNYFLVDFSDYFDDVTEWVFTDWCHLTPGANFLLAKELANLVKEHIFARPLDETDKIKEKDSFFWDLAASGTVKYAPAPDSSDVGPENVLRGYPGEVLFSARSVKDQPLEMVFDFGEAHTMSRIRVVWADEASVPHEWEMETSLDEKQWEPFVRATSQQTDSFSRWPGFEYYAAKPVQARFVRYKPIRVAERSIRLRSLSVYR
ncbi:discoidin domain-containing protein [Desulfomonile tiedjei]|uniref:F5/8 type C domain-containing protein n=1 Tax=Desulfomonile tiedjei (strain ATCC 49306 / DSM 6799 / DCB-1) TaxID=706587 RepID=I4CA22_DESTA|nr:discoidin domain-containing protein [Desulfomonile tiedjei]AFM26413.1 F5/8 type C domain-containing protein [Desulfomonile tiedjei DSM 6799]